MASVFDLDRTIWVGLIVSWDVFVVISTSIFIKYRSNLTIKFRNVWLTLLGVLATILVSNLYFSTILFPAQIPCHMILWVLSLGPPVWFLTFFGKFFLLAFSYQIARSKLKASTGFSSNDNLSKLKSLTKRASGYQSSIESNNPNEAIAAPFVEVGSASQIFTMDRELNNIELGRNWYHQNKNRMTTQSVLVIMVILLGFHALIAALTQWLDNQYNAQSKPLMNCIQGYGMIPLFATAIIYFGVGGPLLALLMWSAKDAYLLKLELVLLVMSSSPFILLFLVFTYVQGLQEVLYPAVFLLIFHLLTHFSSIILPLIDVYRNSFSKTENSYSKFLLMLKNSDQFADFKEFTVSDFTIENPLFYEEYMTFLTNYDPGMMDAKGHVSHHEIRIIPRSILPSFLTNWQVKHKPKELIKSSGSQSDLRDRPDGSITLQMQDLSPQTNSFLSPLCSQPTINRPLTSNEIRDLIQIYDKFIAPGSDYQLNLLGTTVKQIKQSMNQQNYDARMFFPALSEVVDSMYRSTYVRFIKFQQF